MVCKKSADCCLYRLWVDVRNVSCDCTSNQGPISMMRAPSAKNKEAVLSALKQSYLFMAKRRNKRRYGKNKIVDSKILCSTRPRMHCTMSWSGD